MQTKYLIKHMYCQPHYLAGKNPCKCELGCSNNTAQGSTRWQENSNSSSQKAQQNHNDFQIYLCVELAVQAGVQALSVECVECAMQVSS